MGAFKAFIDNNIMMLNKFESVMRFSQVCYGAMISGSQDYGDEMAFQWNIPGGPFNS
jgi:hypothetical protein